MKGALIAMLVFVAIVQVMVKPGEAVTCGQVECVFGPLHSLSDCRRNSCTRSAVMAAAARYPSIKEDAASSLPQKCGVAMDIPISKTTNCAK
ncbi:Non-specific lipid-transfer protein [Melia azedarach]|uniref:Non-specific lipid-transfer protein n=1 Tax=Melia azedarach TaxID=155640 RepID=A0ACC1XGV8_MELAZ|nr:Non-specific lipid-transfer protein [Melia azedarach]